MAGAQEESSKIKKSIRIYGWLRMFFLGCLRDFNIFGDEASGAMFFVVMFYTTNGTHILSSGPGGVHSPLSSGGKKTGDGGGKGHHF